MPLIFVVALSFFSNTARAGNIGLSARALGMGNAYTAIVSDSDSAFYNPAGYADMAGFQWTAIDPSIGLNSLEKYQAYSNVVSGGDIAATLNSLYGNAVSAYAGASKTLVGLGGFAAGAYGFGEANFLLTNPVFPTLSTGYRVDYGYILGWGGEIVEDYLSLGVQGRRVTRQGGQVPIGPEILATLDPDEIQRQLNRKGQGDALDLGIRSRLPMPLNPTVSLTWRDFGDTSFTAEAGALTPEKDSSEMILGVGLSAETLVLGFSLAADYRFLNQEKALGKKLSMGVELSFPIVDVRVGLHQGYLSAGLGFDFWLLRMDLATYGEELGAYPGQLLDRRYLLQIGLHFALGAGGLFSTSKARSSKGAQGTSNVRMDSANPYRKSGVSKPSPSRRNRRIRRR